MHAMCVCVSLCVHVCVCSWIAVQWIISVGNKAYEILWLFNTLWLWGWQNFQIIHLTSFSQSLRPFFVPSLPPSFWRNHISLACSEFFPSSQKHGHLLEFVSLFSSHFAHIIRTNFLYFLKYNRNVTYTRNNMGIPKKINDEFIQISSSIFSPNIIVQVMVKNKATCCK